MFRGSSTHTIDAKGRIIIPARFRDTIKAGGEYGVMVAQMDNCLNAYPYEKWRGIEDSILAQSRRSESMRRFRRFFVGGAYDCVCDKQDRILIPPFHREYAGLQKEVILVGVLDHFEIWSKENFELDRKTLAEDQMREDVREEIATLGL